MFAAVIALTMVSCGGKIAGEKSGVDSLDTVLVDTLLIDGDTATADTAVSLD